MVRTSIQGREYIRAFIIFPPNEKKKIINMKKDKNCSLCALLIFL